MTCGVAWTRGRRSSIVVLLYYRRMFYRRRRRRNLVVSRGQWRTERVKSWWGLTPSHAFVHL